jgi:hypothetical protein
MPELMRSIFLSRRLAAGLVSGAFLTVVAFFSARVSREVSHSCTQSGMGSEGMASGVAAAMNMSARACLQGNLRLGQEHLKAGSARVIWVW